MLTDLDLMNIHAKVLFIHDQNGRMVSLNRPDRRLPPQFFLGRTGEGNIWRFRNNVPENTLVKLDMLAAAEPVSFRLDDSPVHFQEYLRILKAHSRLSIPWRGPAYRFSNQHRVKQSRNRIVEIQQNNAHYLEKEFPT
jgi:hypothetical protein